MFLVSIAFMNDSGLPIALMHGFSQNKWDFEPFASHLSSLLPGRIIVNCEVGNGGPDSLGRSIDWQVEQLSECVQDPRLRDGFIAIGFSNGGLLFRSYIEKYNGVRNKVRRFISLSAPLAGFYCGVKEPCWLFGQLSSGMIKFAGSTMYNFIVQNTIGPAGYWRDPYQIQEYLRACKVLPYLDNEKMSASSATYKRNFESLEQLVLIGSKNDGAISPWQSAWFGFFQDGNDEIVLEAKQRRVYTENLFGLRTLWESGRVNIVNSGLEHSQHYKDQAFIDGILLKYLY